MKKADFIAEVTALAWRWFLRLVQRGKDPAEFVLVIAPPTKDCLQDGS
jgi:hypothetical protein